MHGQKWTVFRKMPADFIMCLWSVLWSGVTNPEGVYGSQEHNSAHRKNLWKKKKHPTGSFSVGLTANTNSQEAGFSKDEAEPTKHWWRAKT